MSNILIIKHGSLGDIAQASGAIQDICENHKSDKIFILTTKPFIELFKKHPRIDEVILDKRLPRYRLIYLFLLMKKLKKLKFLKIFDLQNSSRTSFYKRVLFPNSNLNRWSSSETTLPKNTTKDEFDKNTVLDRFDHQLKLSDLKTEFTLKPDFSWSCSDITNIISNYNLNKYILLFPFCSPHLESKKWPFYNDLIKLLKNHYGEKYKIVIAPGPNEIKESESINAEIILDNGKSLNISQLSSLIRSSEFVVANDTGPAHMTAHLNTKGISLFGSHTTAHKVSIEREKFKAIQVTDLKKLGAERVFERVKKILN
tara:strand:- start:1195 stop:2136 length:942 start_codon:yes stop_codon:yes gene_type:complete